MMEQKSELEDLKEALEAYKAYDFYVAHELRNPITAILTLAESLLASDAGIEAYREFLGDICVEMRREADLVQDLLWLAGCDAGEEQMEEVSIRALLTEECARYATAAREKRLAIESDRTGDEKICLYGGTHLFSMIVKNYLENAIRYSPEDTVIHMNARSLHVQGREYLLFYVMDSGCGIKQEALAHVFERFYRVNKAESREKGGTGLGLAIVKKAAEKMGGRAGVKSILGEGSVFYTIVPCES